MEVRFDVGPPEYLPSPFIRVASEVGNLPADGAGVWYLQADYWVMILHPKNDLYRPIGKRNNGILCGNHY